MRLINIEDVSLLKTVSYGGLSAKALWKRIKEQPIVDAVEVVRCKDCIISETFQRDSNGTMERYCKAFTHLRMVDDDDYCSYGKRREDGEA